MANIIDYLSWRGDLTFALSPFCEVDNLILSMLSFINYSGIVPTDQLGTPVKLSDCYKKKKALNSTEHFGKIIPAVTYDLFVAAATSKRFEDTYVTFYKDETSVSETKQFAAVTFILPDNSLFVAYRGTDDSIVGWREDFNLSFSTQTMSQKAAVDYLTSIASVFGGKIRLGGHSKGGNLAVYAAVFSGKEIRNRIITAYSNDGPGFVEEIVQSAEFKEMEPKIYTIVPQSSLIGMLLEHKEEYHVIESTNRTGVFQHNPFSWTVLGTSFIHLDSLSKSGKRHDEVITNWLGSISAEERRVFTETLFNVIESTGATTLTELSDDQFTKIATAVKAYNGLAKETKEQMFTFIKRLVSAIRQ
ncbi:MAG: DUF2974 domain-containing protein [Ruminococcaceae bacterium]|nr:DUF2974 domain-containing protein [Oscillospiraceae bacterium]